MKPRLPRRTARLAEEFNRSLPSYRALARQLEGQQLARVTTVMDRMAGMILALCEGEPHALVPSGECYEGKPICADCRMLPEARVHQAAKVWAAYLEVSE